MGMRLVPLALTLLLAACADPASVAPRAEPSPGEAQRYEVVATVLQSPAHGPQACLGAIAESLPPQCGGPDVVPFDWNAVDGEQSVRGTSWGEYRLVGTYDGRTIRLTEPPVAATRTSPPRPDRFPMLCDDARVTDPSRLSDADWTATATWARAQPDFAGLWLSWPHGVPTSDVGLPDGPQEAYTIVNVAFTGDLDAHRRGLAARWGGAVCVGRLARPYRELARVQDDLDARHDELARLGIQVGSTSVDEVGNVVEVGVVLADDAARRWMDEHYGAGVVVLHGVLQPVPR